LFKAADGLEQYSSFFLEQGSIQQLEDNPRGYDLLFG